MYSIKAIAKLTGLGSETLRAWERRYRVIVPRRDDNGRRLYSQEDMEKLALLAELTRKGHSIGKLVGLQICALQGLLAAGEGKSENQGLFCGQIVEALLQFKLDRCERLLKKGLMANEPLAYLSDILTPALHAVGALWHGGKLSIAQEHMFSTCVKRLLMGMVVNLHRLSVNNPGMLFATPSGERHEFGILMCCVLAAEQHYNCYYLGPDVPVADTILAAGELNADIVVLSLVKSPPDAETETEVTRIVALTEAMGVTVWLGGEGAVCWRQRQQNLPSHCRVIADIEAFHANALQWRYTKRGIGDRPVLIDAI